MATVVLLGTLDTKGTEYGFLRDQLEEAGVEVLLVDAGVMGEPGIAPDVTRREVARAGGADVAALAAAGDRGAAIATMARGATAIVGRLFGEGRLQGVLALGGSGGSALATEAMRALPIGVPKLMVSTVASGDTRPYVGAVDVAMLSSVVDIAGIDRVSAAILTNAAANPAPLVLCHGGPIAEPEDAAEVLRRTRGVVGFYGASSVERPPTETAIAATMRRFKAIPVEAGSESGAKAGTEPGAKRGG